MFESEEEAEREEGVRPREERSERVEGGEQQQEGKGEIHLPPCGE
jgi:hypothetical protein